MKKCVLSVCIMRKQRHVGTWNCLKTTCMRDPLLFLFLFSHSNPTCYLSMEILFIISKIVKMKDLITSSNFLSFDFSKCTIHTS